MKEKLTTVGVILALGLSLVGVLGNEGSVVREIVREQVGAAPGPDHRNGVEYFYDGLADGGGCMATSTASSGNVAGTLTAAQMQRHNCFKVTVNAQGGMTLTLPATSTMSSVLPAVGMHRTWIIENATSTTGTTLTVAAGTGINLVSVTTNDDVIDGTERMVMDCWRRADHDWDCRVDELLNAD